MGVEELSQVFADALGAVREGIRRCSGGSLDDAVAVAAEVYRLEQQITAELLAAANVVTSRVVETYSADVFEEASAEDIAGDILAKRVGITCRFGQQLTGLGKGSAGRLKACVGSVGSG